LANKPPVTAELDADRILEQETARIDHSNSVKEMPAMGRDVERRVLVYAVKANAYNGIQVYSKALMYFEGEAYALH